MFIQQTSTDAAEVAQQMMWLGIRLEGWLVIAAVILGPIVAIQVQQYCERRRQERARKLWLFRELMATRTMRVSGRHVEALNCIDLEFERDKKSDAKVLDAWKMYLDALNSPPTDDIQRAARLEEAEKCFVNLMWEMGQYLGLSFDKVAIRRDVYSPVAHGELEEDQLLIRKGIIEVLAGRLPLPIQSWPLPERDPRRIDTEPKVASARIAESTAACDQPPSDDEDR